MVKDVSKIKDWRSTGRRIARRTLFKARIDFACVGYTSEVGIHYPCGKTTTEPPKDAPAWFEDIWPEENRVLNPQSLQADHESKDYQNNALEDLNWRCSSCHKFQDKQTDKGVATVQNTISKLF
jgi:hypothetical protein